MTKKPKAAEANEDHALSISLELFCSQPESRIWHSVTFVSPKKRYWLHCNYYKFTLNVSESGAVPQSGHSSMNSYDIEQAQQLFVVLF